jgi:hypothetical protein
LLRAIRSRVTPSTVIATATLGSFLQVSGIRAPKTRRRLILSVLATALAALLVTAASASAAIFHPFLSSFDGSATPAGSFGQGPAGVALDNSAGVSAGDVYLAGSTQSVVNKFSPAPSSAYLCQITGAGSATTSPSECDTTAAGTPAGSLGNVVDAAVDPATGALYVVDLGGTVDKFNASGAYQSQVTGLTTPISVAVDHTTGDLYIADIGAGVVDKFDPSTSTLTTFATGTPGGSFAAPFGIAVDNSSGPSAGDVYLSESGSSVVDKFDSSGTFLSQLTGTPGGAFGSLRRLAVDSSTGDLYVADNGSGVVDQFGASGSFLGSLKGSATTAGSMVAAGIGVASSGHVYVADDTNHLVDVFGPGVIVPDVTADPATAVQATSATLNGTVNPASIQLTDCHFDYGTTTSYGQTAPCVPDAASIPADSSDHAVHADVTGLTSGTAYHFRLVAANANGQNQSSDATFSTPPRPSIDAAAAQNLTLTDADLTATINPNGFDTTYHFEYGTDTSYGTSVPIPDAGIGSGTSDVSVSQHLTSLTQNTTYHWRLLATNANGTAGAGADHTFVYDTTGQGLPDGRGYEQVTPVHKNGANIGDILFGQPPTLAADGSRLSVSTVQCFGDAGACTVNRGLIGAPYTFARASAGWQASALLPPASQLPAATGWFGNPDDGTTLFSAPSAPSGQDDFYVRRPDGSIAHVGPLTPPALGPVGPTENAAGSVSLGTADLSHVVFQPDTLRWPFDPTPNGGASIYEWSGTDNAQPHLVAVTGGQGSTDLISSCGTIAFGQAGDVPGKLSADGNTVFFTAAPCGSGSGANAGTPVPVDTLYARIHGSDPAAHTVPISQRSAADCTASCQSSPPGAAEFVGASRDGSKAFFTSTQQLTDSATQDPSSGDSATDGGGCPATTGPGGCNLYLYDFSRPPGHELLDVSAGDSSGGGPRVQGAFAVVPNGSAYFVAQGVLTTDPNAQGQRAHSGADNLYLYDAGTGQTRFIAGLPAQDQPHSWAQGIPGVQTNVTPDGRFLVFSSRGALTPDTGPSGVPQVFRYDAQSAQLIRISIGNHGFNDNGNAPASTQCPFPSSCPDAARLAPVFQAVAGGPRPNPTMSDDGSSVFFMSAIGLTPHALDSVRTGTDNQGNPEYAQNVYEWHAGQVSLISDGRDTANPVSVSGCPVLHSAVCLFGTDQSGQNVFFTTADQLVPQDTDTQVDFYDARVGGGIPFTPPPEPCQGEACQGAPTAPPIFATPASVTLNGPGNLAPPTPPQKPKPLTSAQKLAKALKACRIKHDKHKRAACERQARKRYGPTKSKSHKGGK